MPTSPTASSTPVCSGGRSVNGDRLAPYKRGNKEKSCAKRSRTRVVQRSAHQPDKRRAAAGKGIGAGSTSPAWLLAPLVPECGDGGGRSCQIEKRCGKYHPSLATGARGTRVYGVGQSKCNERNKRRDEWTHAEPSWSGWRSRSGP